MSAQLQGDSSASSFHARLVLAASVSVTINAPSLQALSNVVALLQPTEAANEAPGKPAATVPAGSTGTQTAASSAQAAAGKDAGDAGNAASTGTPASAQPAAGGSVASGEAGNASAGAHPGAGSAQTASADKPAESSAVTFDELKKAFLALSTKAGGREKCEGVLKPFGLAKLSAATEAQYPAVLAEIKKASA